jgi:uncharacterized protein YukE
MLLSQMLMKATTSTGEDSSTIWLGDSASRSLQMAQVSSIKQRVEAHEELLRQIREGLKTNQEDAKRREDRLSEAISSLARNIEALTRRPARVGTRAKQRLNHTTPPSVTTAISSQTNEDLQQDGERSVSKYTPGRITSARLGSQMKERTEGHELDIQYEA